MDLKKRINRYLIGVGLGILLSIAFFGNRNWTGWMPGNRVLDRLRATYVSDARGNCLLSCHGLGHSKLEEILSRGKVDFKASDTRSQPLVYVVGEKADNGYSFRFEANESEAHLIGIEKSGGPSCQCP
jgi:hypothetical protein